MHLQYYLSQQASRAEPSPSLTHTENQGKSFVPAKAVVTSQKYKYHLLLIMRDYHNVDQKLEMKQVLKNEASH